MKFKTVVSLTINAIVECESEDARIDARVAEMAELRPYIINTTHDESLPPHVDRAAAATAVLVSLKVALNQWMNANAAPTATLDQTQPKPGELQ